MGDLLEIDWGYQEHWALVRQIRPILVESGLKYWLDLMNEAVPLNSMSGWLTFTRRLWQDYIIAYGASDTLGFSSTEEAPRMETVRAIYGNVMPPFLDVHIYQPKQTVKAIHAELARQGLETWPWVVGETYYNDPDLLADLRGAAKEANAHIFYILQWPNARGGNCPVASTVPLQAPSSLTNPPP